MANPNWPAGVPHPTYDLAEGDVDSFFIRTSTDAGVAKQRMRFTGIAVPISATIQMTRAQYTVFKEFCKDTIKYVLPFTWVDMFDDTTVVTCRLTKRPVAKRSGYDLVEVSINYEVLP